MCAMQAIPCGHCGEPFAPKRSSQRFCSRRCAGEATARKRGQRGKIKGICQACGGEWEDYASNGRVYCSKRCESTRLVKERPCCERCGEPVRKMHNRYCSKRCSNLAEPRGIGEATGITSWPGFYDAAQKANPDPKPCADCGAPGQHRHHEQYEDPTLIVWLCTGCHSARHPNRRLGQRFRPDEVPLPK